MSKNRTNPVKKGRKSVQIDWLKLDTMLMFDASLNTCAMELGCCHDALEGAVKREKGMTFGEYKKLQLGKTVLRLKQKMIQLGLNGNIASLIFSLKNLSDWKDKVENSFAENSKIEINISQDDSGL